MGYGTVDESARAVIAERLARGESPRPGPLAFAQEILRRDAEKYAQHQQGSRWVFFDRCVLEALAMAQDASPLPSGELDVLLRTYTFHRVVFVLPPWKAIYVTDAERDHSFEHVARVHAQLVTWYASCGYTLHEVPRLPAVERARYVLHAIGDHGA